MSLARSMHWVSPEEYLAAEFKSDVRHEYFAGEVFAMAGASLEHNRLAGDIFTALNVHLRGKRCEAFINDMKAHVRKEHDEWFYYPDVMVTCDPAGLHKYYCETPCIIFEVLSPDTEALDRREKRMAYQGIPTLHTYVLVAQDRRELTVYRRGEGDWTRELLPEQGTVLRLPQIEFELTLDTIYARVGV